MKKSNKRAISLLVIATVLVVAFVMPVNALWNGSGAIKNNNNTTIGHGYLWNSSDYYTLYAQTESSSGNVNYIASQSLAKSIQGWDVCLYQSTVAYRTSASYSPEASVTILSPEVPLEARGIFGMNSYSIAMCYTYNLGSGCSVCNCGFANDRIND